jgi:hypothetical protein
VYNLPTGMKCYHFIMQQVVLFLQAIELPPLPANARYIYHTNECYDWGTFGWAIMTQNVVLSKYRYFIFMNSSIRGPFLPAYVKVLDFILPNAVGFLVSEALMLDRELTTQHMAGARNLSRAHSILLCLLYVHMHACFVQYHSHANRVAQAAYALWMSRGACLAIWQRQT